MGHRLSKIYTKTGDYGTTGLGDGSRVAKNNIRVDAYGTVDELNSFIGVLRAQLEAASSPFPHSLDSTLSRIQHELFDLGGELCIPHFRLLKPASVEKLEQDIDRMNEHLPMLKDFILPAGSLATSYAHAARSICRRAERLVFSLSQLDDSDISATALQYLNRLSDWLFVAARHIAREDGGTEVLWQKHAE
jgi:cob(I)alamin adenosyltransferase